MKSALSFRLVHRNSRVSCVCSAVCISSSSTSYFGHIVSKLAMDVITSHCLIQMLDGVLFFHHLFYLNLSITFGFFFSADIFLFPLSVFLIDLLIEHINKFSRLNLFSIEHIHTLFFYLQMIFVCAIHAFLKLFSHKN